MLRSRSTAIDTTKLAAAVRGKRGDRRLEDVAPELDMTVATLSRIENERFTPSLETFARLCRWLGVEMDYFAAAPREGE
jgi:transcriptional regulator with XRE-family HTH domain